MNLGKIIKKLWIGEIKPTLIFLSISTLTYATAFTIGYLVVKKEIIKNDSESNNQRIERLNYLFGTDIFEHFKMNQGEPYEEYIYKREGNIFQQTKKYVDGVLPDERVADGQVDKIRLEKYGPVDFLIYTLEKKHGNFNRKEDYDKEKELFEEANQKMKELKETFKEYIE